MASAFGANPAYGLLAGSVAFAGGHGSAISYGQLAADHGLPGAIELGLACATFGLIAGGLVGGPIARRLITKYNLSGNVEEHASVPGSETTSETGAVTLNGMLDSIHVLAICIAAGAVVNGWIDMPLLVILLVQIAVMASFAGFVIFPLMGRDYDAAVMAAGFSGLGLGATTCAKRHHSSIVRKMLTNCKEFFRGATSQIAAIVGGCKNADLGKSLRYLRQLFDHEGQHDPSPAIEEEFQSDHQTDNP